MAFEFAQSQAGTVLVDLDVIASISIRTAQFWAEAHGWAPKDAADALSRARLDWLASFSRTLKFRVQEVTEHPDEPAALICAWVHLRTLVEGNLKLFLTVFLSDYMADSHAPKSQKAGTSLEPDTLSLEAIRQFLVKRDLLPAHHSFIEIIQKRGNTIHAFADKPIGSGEEFLECLHGYRLFLADLEDSLPNPYS